MYQLMYVALPNFGGLTLAALALPLVAFVETFGLANFFVLVVMRSELSKVIDKYSAEHRMRLNHLFFFKSLFVEIYWEQRSRVRNHYRIAGFSLQNDTN